MTRFAEVRRNFMNNKMIAALFAAVMFTACGSSEADIPDASDTSEEVLSETETISEMQSETVSVSEAAPETSQETETQTETVSETVQETDVEELSEDHKALYKEQLLNYLNEAENNNSTDIFFDLYDLDNDGVPELFLSTGSYHVANVRIFSVAGGKLKEFSDPTSGNYPDFGEYGCVKIRSDGCLFSEYAGMGCSYDRYFRLEQGELKKVLECEYWDHIVGAPEGMDGEMYIVNGTEVPKEEYDKAKSDYSDMIPWFEAGRRYELTEENINTVFDGNNDSSYKAEYSNILTDIINSDSYIDWKDIYSADPTSVMTYDLLDIDMNGIPELLVSNGKAHSSGVRIFTVTDGKAVEIQNDSAYEGIFEMGFGEFGRIKVSPTGYVLSEYSGNGSEYRDYYRFKDGSFERVLSADHHEFAEDYGFEYGIEDKQVTEEEYYQAIENLGLMPFTSAGERYLLDIGYVNAMFS